MWKSANPISANSPGAPKEQVMPLAGLKVWLLAARPKTLWAGIVPVLIGTAMAIRIMGRIPRSSKNMNMCLKSSMTVMAFSSENGFVVTASAVSGMLKPALRTDHAIFMHRL